MFGHPTRVLGAVALLAGLAGVLCSDLKAGNRSAHTGTVRIGLISSLFIDVPEPVMMLMRNALIFSPVRTSCDSTA